MAGKPPYTRSDESFHQILASLTVIIGNAQLLERKIARGDAVAPELILATLSSIQRAGHKAVEHLRESRQEEAEHGD